MKSVSSNIFIHSGSYSQSFIATRVVSINTASEAMKLTNVLYPAFLIALLMRLSNGFGFPSLNTRKPSTTHHLCGKRILGVTGVAALSSILFFNSPMSAEASGEYSSYRNDRFHTSLKYPSDWLEKNGDLSGGRSVDAFVDPKDSDVSASVVYTPIPADFTKLTSFGDLQSYLLPKNQDGYEYKLISESTKGNMYILEYIAIAPKTENLPERHVKTVFALRPAETVVGLTIQSPEEKFESSKTIFDSVFSSFTFQDKNE